MTDVARVFREEHGRTVAVLTRVLGDLDLAEDAVQDAFVTALTHWPEHGVPPSPAGWILTTARNRAIDRLRREAKRDDRQAQAALLHAQAEPEEDAVQDDRLRLIFTCCHPALAPNAQVALTLRLLGGLDTTEIARAFLVPEPTVAQRIVRAKRTLAEKRIPFEIPRGPELNERLASVLEVIYLTFNEGYSATEGEDWMRPQLCEEALRLGRILCGLMPQEAEVLGLTALMEIQASRIAARIGPQGEPILLLDQNRALWDQLLIRRGLAALAHAETLTSAFGRYGLQAAIAACHARATKADQTDWTKIASLYDALATLETSPVVELNRAVAYSMARGPQAGLDMVDALLGAEALKDYHLLPSVRGDLLTKLGRLEEAETEFRRAASLTQNAREKSLLLARTAACRQ